MTKHDMARKWGGIIAALWDKQDNENIPDKYYDCFLNDCLQNGYANNIAKAIWQNSLEYADTLDFEFMPKLQKLRLSRGLSITQAAFKAGISVSEYQEYEQGRKILSEANIEIITDLAETLGIQPKDIV